MFTKLVKNIDISYGVAIDYYNKIEVLSFSKNYFICLISAKAIKYF